MGATAKSLAQLGMEAAATPGTIVAAKMLMPGTHKFHLEKHFDQPIEMRGSYDSHFENIQPLTRYATWDIDGEYYPETNLNVWLMCVNNSPTIFAVRAPAGATYSAYNSWIFNPGDVLGTFTWEEFDGTASWQYPWSFADKIELDFTPEKIVTYKLSGAARDRIAMGSPNLGLNVTTLPQPVDIPLPGATAKLTIDNIPTTTPTSTAAAVSVPTAPSGAASSGGTLVAATYFYKVTAYSDYGESQASTETSGVVVTANQKVTLTWTAPTTGTPTGYRIWRGTATGTETLLATQTGTAVTFVDDGATSYTVSTATPPTTSTTPITAPTTVAGTAAGTGGTLTAATYFYKVTAFNQWGETVASAESTGVVVTAGQKVTLTWTAPTAGTAVGYNIYRSTTSGSEVYVDSDGASPYVDAGGQSVTTIVPPVVNGTAQFTGVQSNLNVLSSMLSLELQQKEIFTINNAGTFTRVYRGRRKGTVELEIDFLNLGEYNDFINFKYKVFQFTFTGKPLTATSSQTEQLVVTMPCTYVSYEIDKSKEHATAKVMGDIMLDPNLGYSHQVRASVNASATSNY